MAVKPPARSSAKAKVAIPQLAWNKVRPAPIVLVSGTEGFLADRAIRLLRETLKVEDPSLEVSDLEVSDLEADQYAPGELISLASPSLFSEPRLIRITNVEKCTDAFITETLSYLNAPADDTYVVLRHAGGVRGKKLLDAIRAGAGGGIEIMCVDLKKDTEKYEFAAAEFSSKGRRVTPGALRTLVSAFSADLAELAAACQQLIADDADEINEATVARYYSGRVETSAFKVADSAIAGRPGEALVLLRHALASGADPVPIVAAFAMKLRTMAKLSGGSMSSGQAAKTFGMAPWQAERAMKDVKGWSDEGLGAAIETIADTDAQVKGLGRDPVFALERMIAVVAARGNR
ncbi:DNA polymerase III, delta subunit [marine actinobacterium PHSC20C1]|nr:DNA polymerase III, delta subunit [marine actinobacterium PHSC20C1]